MDRALNPEHLLTALGNSAGLPSVTELSSMLAASEAALLRGSQHVDDRVLATGWFLHSVGSALPALEIYGIARQRSAFQVAGHIFDLALNSPELDEIDRLRLTFGSQVADLRGALDPNALAAYRWRIQSDRVQPALRDPTTSLQVGTALLAYDTHWLFPALQGLRSELRAMEAGWGVDPRETMFASIARVIDGAWALLLFLVYGDQANLELARTSFQEGAVLEHPVLDLDARWVAFHLWQLCDHIGRSSLWSILPPDTPPSVPRAFTMARPPILTMWPPQVDLLSRDRHPYALDPGVRRLVLSVPTSAGKTLLAQLLAADHLARTASGVCFVAPTRSLCREIEASLRRRLRMIARAEDVQFADSMFADLLNDEPAVEIMTPERLAYLLRLDPDAVLARFGLFVVDEVHGVGDPGRGWTLEWVLATLHLRTKETRHRIIAMSAALGNSGVLAGWLDPAGVGFHFSSEWRGPRRVHAIYTTARDQQTATRLPRPRSNSPERVEYDLHGVLHLRPTTGGRVQSMQTTTPIGKLVLRVPGFTRDEPLSTPFYKTLAPLARILGRAGPVLVICPTKVEAARLATEIAGTFTDTVGTSWLAELASARLGAGHQLVGCLRRGVAYHHASLPSDVLLAIESELIEGGLQFVVATTTLTEGVNLPVRTVIIAAQGVHGPAGFQEFIIGARLLNAIGRAGRAGKESEGWVVLARNATFNRADFARLAPTEVDIPIQSVLGTADALAELARLEEAIAQGADLALARAGSFVEAFLSYVWYVASVAETEGAEAEEQVDASLSCTLAWQQLPPAQRERYRAVARRSLDAYAQRPLDTRMRWSRAGTSLATAAEIEAIADEVANLLRGRGEPTIESVDDALELTCGGDRLSRLIGLPESKIEHPKNQRGGAGTRRIRVDHRGLLRDWVAGGDVQHLANSYLAEVRDPEFRLEELADFITSAFDNFLPWALSLVIEWANKRLTEDEDYEGPELDAALPALVRYGVDSGQAVRLIRAGLPSRSLAAAIARDYTANLAREDQTLREWLCTSDLGEWRTRFGASPLDLRALLEFARPPGTRLAAELLAGESVTIPVRMTTGPRHDAGVEIREMINEPAPARLGLWVGDENVAVVLPEHFAEVDAVRATGIPLTTTLEVVADSQVATLRLTDLAAVTT